MAQLEPAKRVGRDTAILASLGLHPIDQSIRTGLLFCRKPVCCYAQSFLGFAQWAKPKEVECGGGRSITFRGLLRGQRAMWRIALLLLLGGWWRWGDANIGQNSSTKTRSFHGLRQRPIHERVLQIMTRKPETNIQNCCKSDDFRTGFKVVKWRFFWRLTMLQSSATCPK